MLPTSFAESLINLCTIFATWHTKFKSFVFFGLRLSDDLNLFFLFPRALVISGLALRVTRNPPPNLSLGYGSSGKKIGP